ncbi:MAG TPA: ABC transporter permease [Vicinamibacterales bacterium]|nr:ABC transporter permease [Vicinamibacterales bacterium]
MNTLVHELRQALRTLLKAPGFATTAILILALGIGATTAMFTVVDGVLLKPLGYREADRIVALSTVFTDRGRQIPRLTGGDFIDIRTARDTFEAIADYQGGEMGVQVSGGAEFVGTQLTGTEFMQAFGVLPLHGRFFTPDDAQRSAIVSPAFARRHFANAEAAIGETIRLEGRIYTIVGVAPEAFQFPQGTQVWLAAAADPEVLERTAYNYRAVARLRADVAIESANARLATVGARLATAYPRSNANKSFAAIPLQQQLVGPVRITLLVLMGAVSLVLLIACANVANLLLARAAVRSREIAVRAALGASRWRIVRQLLAESLVLALVAGALGVAIASLSTSALLSSASQNVPLPRLADVAVDWRVLLFSISLCVITSVGFGLAPAFQTSAIEARDALRKAGRGGRGGPSASLRNTLVVTQIALSFVLLIGAGLLSRSFLSLTSVQMGFRTDSTLVMYAHIPAGTADEFSRVRLIQDALFQRIGQLPGVSSVAGAMGMPTGQYGSYGGYVIEGQGTMEEHAGALPSANFSLSSPGYFSTMGIPLVRGRDFIDRDLAGTTPVVIISEALAQRSFPNQDPIGRRLQCGLDRESMSWMTVVGVVGNVRQDTPASEMLAALYMPLAQHPYRGNEIQVAIHTAVNPETLTETVKQLVRDTNPEIATKFTTMNVMVSDSVSAPRLRTTLAVSFAALALLLTIIGVYAVVSYLTVQRRSEFAIRTAMGASSGAVVRMVVGGAARLAAIGLAAGAILALAVTRTLTTMLFELESTDATTYLIAFAIVLPVVLLAALLPAVRAARQDPIAALRND